MVDLQTIGVLMTGVSVTVAAIYYMFTLRINMKNQELTLKAQQQNLETRQAQLFMGLYQSLFSKDFIEAEFTLWKVKMKNAEDMDQLMKNKEKYIAWNTYGTYYEGIGVLVRESLVDIRLVSLLISGMVIQFWEQYEDVIRDYRRVMNFDRMFIEVEYLYNCIKEYRSQQPELSITTPKWLGDGVSKER